MLLSLPNDLATKVSKHLISGDYTLDAEVEIETQSYSFDYFVLTLDGERLPALLANLATKLETHKIFEGIKLYKSTDIGQILCVFRTEAERDVEKAQIDKHKKFHFNCLPSGITPPMQQVIKKKWTHSRKDPCSRVQVLQVMEEIRSTQNANLSEEIEEIYEEVVPFEKWMVGTGLGFTDRYGAYNPPSTVISLSDSDWGSDTILFQEHPSMLRTKKDNNVDYYLFYKEEDGDLENELIIEDDPATALISSVEVTQTLVQDGGPTVDFGLKQNIRGVRSSDEDLDGEGEKAEEEDNKEELEGALDEFDCLDDDSDDGLEDELDIELPQPQLQSNHPPLLITTQGLVGLEMEDDDEAWLMELNQ